MWVSKLLKILRREEEEWNIDETELYKASTFEITSTVTSYLTLSLDSLIQKMAIKKITHLTRLS